MFGHSEAPSYRLGSRRLGGPFLFKTLWPALREELLQVYVANDESSGLAGATTVCEPSAVEPEARSAAAA